MMNVSPRTSSEAKGLFGGCQVISFLFAFQPLLERLTRSQLKEDGFGLGSTWFNQQHLLILSSSAPVDTLVHRSWIRGTRQQLLTWRACMVRGETSSSLWFFAQGGYPKVNVFVGKNPRCFCLFLLLLGFTLFFLLLPRGPARGSHYPVRRPGRTCRTWRRSRGRCQEAGRLGGGFL